MALSLQEIRKRYKVLLEIIKSRMLFEENNKTPPFITHRTTNNFFDIHGYTLLHYASLSADTAAVSELLKDPAVNIEQLPLYLKGGLTPLEMALTAGHLEVAKILLAQGAKSKHIAAAKVHQDCKAWFNEILLESIHESYPGLKIANFNLFKSSKFFESFVDSSFPRLAELGNLEAVKNGFEEFSYTKSVVQHVLLNAASNGHQEIVEFLISRGIKINPDNSPFSQTALHAAALYHQHQMAQFLLSKGAYINYQNELKKTPLMMAVEANDIVMVRLLLDNNADVLLKDVFGDTVFHHALATSNPEISKLLLENSKKDLLLKSKNIYGFRGIDLAIDSGNEEQLALIFTQDELQKIKNNPLYGQHKPAINHRKLLPIMHYFLALNYRDTEFLQIVGHCNGFSFLRNLYTSRSMKNYFYDTLRLIAKWDGSLETLNKPFPTDIEQSKYHENLASLFEYWTQNVIWFQGTATTDIISISQVELKSKFELARPSKDENIILIIQDNLQSMTREQLGEHLELIKKMPAGVQFNIRRGDHTTSGDLLSSKTKVDYFDPNFAFEADPEQLADSFCDIVIDVKYRAINKIFEDNTMPVSFHVFYFNNQSKDINFDKFELFISYPQTKEEADNYQRNSSCKFTFLHAATLTGSAISLEKLLKDGYCDITAKDAFGRTIFDIAIRNQSAEILAIILKYADNKFNIAKAIFRCTEAENELIDLLMSYSKPADLISLGIKNIRNKNIAYVEQFLKTNKQIINEKCAEGQNLLLTALNDKSFSIVDLLIKNGASSLVVAQTNLYGESIKSSSLNYVIDQNMTDYYELILGDYSSQFLGLLIAFSEGKPQQDLELLKEINFDLKDSMHYQIMANLLVSAIKLKKYSFFIELTKKADSTLLDQLHEGKPLIVHAILDENLDMLEALLKKGVTVDAQTIPGKNTALHVAIKKNIDAEFITLLLNHDADTSLKNKEGLNATQLAKGASEEIQRLISPSQYRPSLF
ncbi:MAG: ankyrin repeat domain-containing protein [Tatlockia sp.]|nr:ankyrin repeat domain-containing protein [Tatlockia sp.]